MTPAQEIAAAAQKLRTATPAEPALIRVREPLAAWLDSWTGIELRESATMQEDARHALAIARAINGGEQP